MNLVNLVNLKNQTAINLNNSLNEYLLDLEALQVLWGRGEENELAAGRSSSH